MFCEIGQCVTVARTLFFRCSDTKRCGGPVLDLAIILSISDIWIVCFFFYLPYDTMRRADTSAVRGWILVRGSLTYPKEEVLSRDVGCLMIREETVKDSHYDNISP